MVIHATEVHMARRKSDETFVDLEAEVKYMSGKAMLVDIDGEDYWIPYSQIAGHSQLDNCSEKGDEGVLVIAEWLAEKKGLVEEEDIPL
jgi:hypothetical protein